MQTTTVQNPESNLQIVRQNPDNKYPFYIVCENIDAMEPLLHEFDKHEKPEDSPFYIVKVTYIQDGEEYYYYRIFFSCRKDLHYAVILLNRDINSTLETYQDFGKQPDGTETTALDYLICDSLEIAWEQSELVNALMNYQSI